MSSAINENQISAEIEAAVGVTGDVRLRTFVQVFLMVSEKSKSIREARKPSNTDACGEKPKIVRLKLLKTPYFIRVHQKREQTLIRRYMGFRFKT